MPFLRVIRDKRGYKTTYLMHWYREGTRQRSRVLYVFRTPGGVRVGRAPLNPDIQQELETRHPEIEFDWKSVVDNQQVIESGPDLRRPRKRRREDEEEAPVEVAEAPKVESPPPQPRFSVPSAVEGATPDEQMAFLARWYGLVLERVPMRTTDPARQQILMTLAERLNAASWTDADQITAGLQQAGEALERLSHVFAKRRRRPRRPANGAPRPEAAEAVPSSASDESPPAAAPPDILPDK